MDKDSTNKIRYAAEITNCTYRETIFYMWTQLALKGISVADFFRTNGLRRIVVYGYGRVGKLVCREIEKCDDLSLVAVIDKNYKKIDCNFTGISPEDTIPEHDILISTYTDTNYVRNKLAGRSDSIVGFDEVLKGYGI